MSVFLQSLQYVLLNGLWLVQFAALNVKQHKKIYGASFAYRGRIKYYKHIYDLFQSSTTIETALKIVIELSEHVSDVS